jgi:hypothetical protein
MKEILCRAFCDSLQVHRVPSGYAITTSYTYEDGDPIILYAVTRRDKFYQLEDAGVQIALLEGSGITISDGTRGEAFTSLLNEYGLEFDKQAMVVRTPEIPEADVGAAALKLLAFLLRLQDFMLLTPERVRQTWQEDALESLHLKFDGVAKVDEHTTVLPEVAAIPADAVINFHTGGAPLAVFLATTDTKGLQALVLKMELEKYQEKPAHVVLLVERATKNPLREPTYALAQARLDDVLTYRGVEAETMMKLASYQSTTLQ